MFKIHIYYLIHFFIEVVCCGRLEVEIIDPYSIILYKYIARLTTI